MKLPINIEDAKNLGKLLGRYKDLYYFQVLAGLFITYILYPYYSICLLFNRLLCTLHYIPYIVALACKHLPSLAQSFSQSYLDFSSHSIPH